MSEFLTVFTLQNMFYREGVVGSYWLNEHKDVLEVGEIGLAFEYFDHVHFLCLSWKKPKEKIYKLLSSMGASMPLIMKASFVLVCVWFFQSAGFIIDQNRHKVYRTIFINNNKIINPNALKCIEPFVCVHLLL